MTLEEKHQLPVGSHYFKAKFDSVEGYDDIGIFNTMEDTIKAIEEFVENEIEYYLNEEFYIFEYEVINNGDDNFHGKLIKRWTNENGLTFIRY